MGGAEISVQLLAEGLVKSGHKVFVITTGAINSLQKLNGVIIIRVKQHNIYSSFFDKTRSPLLKTVWHILDSHNFFFFRKLSRLLKKIKPDIVHTNNIQGFSPIVWKAVKKANIPLVHTLRDYYLLCHKTLLFKNGSCCESLCADCRITNSIKKSQMLLPDCYVGISDFILEKHGEFNSIHGRKKVVYNAVAGKKSTSNLVESEKITFGYIGRIAADKGVEFLVKELAAVKKEYRSKFKVLFAGKGDSFYINYLAELLEGIDHEFLGVVKPDEFYSRINVAVVPSLWYEPFGRIVIESLAAEVPVCAAQIGGLKELHNDDCMWAFKPEAGQLFPLLQQIIEKPEQIHRKKLRAASYASRFSEELYLKKYLEIYNEIAPIETR